MRYWASWWSTYHTETGCTKPPFQLWESATRDLREGLRQFRGGPADEVAICAMIDAPSEEDVLATLARHFPDYELRFLNVAAADAVPDPTRFPGFRNQTAIV